MAKYFNPLVLDDEYVSLSTCPSMILLLKVLEEAIKDLDDHRYYIREETVAWFSEWHNAMPDLITYKDIRDHVELKPSYIKYMETKVEARRGNLDTPVRIPNPCRYVVR